MDSIPAPPAIPNIETESLSEVVLTTLAEPRFSEIGLGGWWPTGMVQSLLEQLHITLDLPWWGCIAIGMRNLIYLPYSNDVLMFYYDIY